MKKSRPKKCAGTFKNCFSSNLRNHAAAMGPLEHPLFYLVLSLSVFIFLLPPSGVQALDRQLYYDAGDGPHLMLTEGGASPVKTSYYIQNYPGGLSFIEDHYRELGRAYSCLKNTFDWDYESSYGNNDQQGHAILGSLILPLNTTFQDSVTGTPPGLDNLIVYSKFGSLGSSNHLAADPEMVAHEFVHYVIWASSILVGSEEARALSESIADIVALICNDADSGDWQIGDFAFSPNIRDLANPSRSGWQMTPPSHMNDFEHGDSPHRNSLIFSHAIYLWMMGGNFRGVDVSGVSVAKVKKLFFNAMQRLHNSATFKEAYEQLKSEVLFYFTDPQEQAEVYNSLNAAFSAVGIVPLNPAVLPWLDLNERVTAINESTLELTMVVSSQGRPDQAELYYATQNLGFGCDSSWISQATQVTLPDLFGWAGDSTHTLQVENLQANTEYFFCLRQKTESSSDWDYSEIASGRTWPLNPLNLHIAPGGNIQNAIDIAAPGATISLAPGFYNQSINLRGKRLTILGEEDLNQPLSIPVIQASAGSAIVCQGSETSETVLENLAVSKGTGTLVNGKRYGGGIYCPNGSLTIKKLVVNDNSAQIGAGIYLGGRASAGITHIEDTTISNNQSTEDGAGLACMNSCAFDLESSTFWNNKANGKGGAIWIDTTATDLIQIDRANFNYNTAFSHGGAVATLQLAKLQIDRSKFKRNSSESNGGALYFAATSGYIDLNWNSLFHNSAVNGGGVFSIRALDIYHNTFAKNQADVAGGGIYLAAVSAASINSAIFWRNSGPSGAQIHSLAGAGLAVSYSNVEGGWSGNANINLDPVFEDRYWDQTGNLTLNAYSPCLDSAQGAQSDRDPDMQAPFDDLSTPNTGSGAVTFSDRGSQERGANSEVSYVTLDSGYEYGNRWFAAYFRNLVNTPNYGEIAYSPRPFPNSITWTSAWDSWWNSAIKLPSEQPHTWPVNTTKRVFVHTPDIDTRYYLAARYKPLSGESWKLSYIPVFAGAPPFNPYGHWECFAAETPITLANGAQLQIENIKVGDQVLSFDPVSGKATNSAVTDLHRKTVKGYYLINDSIRATAMHPFFIAGRWVAVKDLKIGDKLLSITGKEVPITSIRYLDQPLKVYNLSVADTENYYAAGVLVHNKPPGWWYDAHGIRHP